MNKSQTCAKLVHFCTKYGSPASATVVRSLFVLGQAHTPLRRMLSFALIAVAVLIAPSVVGANPSQQHGVAAGEDAAIVAQSRAAVLGLYSLDRQLSLAQSKLAALRVQARVAARRTAEPSTSTDDREAQHAHLAGTRGRAASCALRRGKRRAARDRVRFEEPRRGDDEPRQPESRHRPGRRRSARARRRAHVDLPRLARARRADDRARRRRRAPPRRQQRRSHGRAPSEARTSPPCPRSTG